MIIDPFKTCPFCGHEWTTREVFLADADVDFIGYQSFINDGVLGLFLFNHLTCETTLTISVERFADLHEGEIYKSREEYEEADPYCLSSAGGRECPARCECGFVRKVIGVIEDETPT